MQGTNRAPDISPEEACVAGAKAARDTLAASKHPLMLMDEMCDSETDTAYAMGWNSIWASAENKVRWNSFTTTRNDIGTGMTNNTTSYAQRVQALARTAAQHYHEGRMEEAELAVYEAGRFGMAIPEMVAENEFLKHHFERGAVDAVQDAADQERVDAITEAGFDPCAPSRKPSSPSPF